MRKKAGIVFIITGAVLLIAALFFYWLSEQNDMRAGEEADRILAELLEAMEESTDAETAEVNEAAQGESASDMPEETAEAVHPQLDDDTAQVDEESAADPTPPVSPEPINVGGYDCIGYIDIPELSLKLPVLADWDYERLDAAPCRHFGSAEGGDLVIAGHNFKRHFAYLSRLNPGDAVMFYDTAGRIYSYKVSKTENVNADAVDAVQNSGFPLVLYTCTYFGDIRTAVFCEKVHY